MSRDSFRTPRRDGQHGLPSPPRPRPRPRPRCSCTGTAVGRRVGSRAGPPMRTHASVTVCPRVAHPRTLVTVAFRGPPALLVQFPPSGSQHIQRDTAERDPSSRTSSPRGPTSCGQSPVRHRRRLAAQLRACASFVRYSAPLQSTCVCCRLLQSLPCHLTSCREAEKTRAPLEHVTLSFPFTVSSEASHSHSPRGRWQASRFRFMDCVHAPAHNCASIRSGEKGENYEFLLLVTTRSRPRGSHMDSRLSLGQRLSDQGAPFRVSCKDSELSQFPAGDAFSELRFCGALPA